MLFMGEGNPVGVIAALAVVIFMLFMLFRPYSEAKTLSAKKARSVA
jgi:multisubunit Na+/H+ antiporter MnhC subunit